MELVLLTAVGVGGATVFGALMGFAFKGITERFSNLVLAFSAGIMLAAAILGLILPSLEYGGELALLITIIGIFSGAALMKSLDVLVPHMHVPRAQGREDGKMDKIMLFILAIAIHNLPEGIAAGVGFGTGDTGNALLIALGIALQNIPEGMVIIAPMLSVGIPAKKTFLLASATGFVEVVGTLLGYFAVSFASFILPFALSFAGGTMLYVISDDLIPEVHSDGKSGFSTVAMIFGFCLMLVMSCVL